MASLGLFLVVVATALAAVSGQTVDDHDKTVVCYFDAYSYYRSDEGKYELTDFDPTLCTHGIYAFADIDDITWGVKATDKWLDLGPQDNCGSGECVMDYYRTFVALKSQHSSFVPMLSVGGWATGSAIWSTLAQDPSKRAAFASSLLDFADTYGFEGFDIDWEFPSVGSGSDEDIDMEDFARLLEDIRTAFDTDGRGLILSAPLAPSKEIVDVSYNISRVFTSVDFATVMAYEFHGFYNLQHYTGHPAPLYRREEEGPGNPGYRLNVYDSIEYYLDQGAPANKLCLGLASHGNGYHLPNASANGLYCDSDQATPGGPFLNTQGIWSYQEIQYALQADDFGNLLPGATPGDWTVVLDTCYLAPYMYNGPYWVGYDDEDSIGYKSQYANYRQLAGAALWSISMDDFSGVYSNNVKYPLLKRINLNFELGINFNPENPSCGSAPMCYFGP